MLQPDEYEKVEIPALEQLKGMGWDYVSGANLSPDESTEGKVRANA